MTSQGDAHAAHGTSAGPAPTSFGNLYPRGDIVAPVRDGATAQVIVDELHRSGFPDGDVEVVGAEFVQQASEELERRRGLLGRLGAIFGEEHDIAQEFAHLSREGYSFVVIHAPDEEAVARASTVLHAHGVTRARHYGRVVITDL